MLKILFCYLTRTNKRLYVPTLFDTTPTTLTHTIKQCIEASTFYTPFISLELMHQAPHKAVFIVPEERDDAKPVYRIYFYNQTARGYLNHFQISAQENGLLKLKVLGQLAPELPIWEKIPFRQNGWEQDCLKFMAKRLKKFGFGRANEYQAGPPTLALPEKDYRQSIAPKTV